MKLKGKTKKNNFNSRKREYPQSNPKQWFSFFFFFFFFIPFSETHLITPFQQPLKELRNYISNNFEQIEKKYLGGDDGEEKEEKETGEDVGEEKKEKLKQLKEVIDLAA